MLRSCMVGLANSRATQRRGPNPQPGTLLLMLLVYASIGDIVTNISLSGFANRRGPTARFHPAPAPASPEYPYDSWILLEMPLGAAKRVSCDTPPCHPHSFDEELGGSAAQPRRRCTLPAGHLDVHFAGQAPRRRGSAASSRSWRASAAGRSPCPRRPARPSS